MIHDESGRGYAQLASDGVLRTFDPHGKILDHMALSPKEITTFAQHGSDEVKAVLAGVDGRLTTDEARRSPDPSILPRKSCSSVNTSRYIHDASASRHFLLPFDLGFSKPSY